MPEEHIWELKAWNMETLKQTYTTSLINEHKDRHKKIWSSQIKTIYIWGGTPFQLWATRLFSLIDSLLETRDTEFLEELSIELNPDPFDEVIAFIKEAQKKYKHLFRLRFSFGIQTFNDIILESSKRNYVFNNLINFFREIAGIKAMNTIYNLDFIAFGDHSNFVDSTDSLSYKSIGDWDDSVKNWLPRDWVRRDFFQKLVESKYFDGYSVYTLELFPGAEWYYDMKKQGEKRLQIKDKRTISKSKLALSEEQESQRAIFSDDPTIWKEFSRLKKKILDAWYKRYEISNFALPWKRSLHNMVYWEFGEYLGIGINASGMLKWDTKYKIRETTNANESATAIDAIRYKNTLNRKKYLWWDRLDETSLITLDEKQVKSEHVMLALRTDRGLVIERFRDVLVDNIDEVITDLVDAKFVAFNVEKWILKLRSKWMDVYNAILLEILDEM